MPKGIPSTDKMLGRKFGKDEHLEVLGWDGSRDPSGLRLYSVKCSICANDPELYGDAIFKFRAACLVKGRVPCECSPGTRWNQSQYRVLLKRQADVGNFEITIPQECFITSDTRLNAECHVCSTKWDAKVNCFRGGRGCPRCGSRRAKANHRKPDIEVVERFLATGAFVDGTTFTRMLTENERGYEVSNWQVYCPICSVDEYVQVGICDGKFRSEHGNLSAGKRPCRCSKQNKWTGTQRQYQINKLCKDQTYSFVRWVDPTKFGAFDKFIAKCDIHEEWIAGVDKFVNGGQRCPSCAKGGFSTQEGGSLYILRIVGEELKFTGFGISNVIRSRLTTHKRNLALKGLKITESTIFDMTGQQAWDLEQLLKKTFPCNPQDIEGFRTEATYYENYQAVIDFVEEWIFNNTD